MSTTPTTIPMQRLEARFLRYVQIDTQSDESSSTTPSTAKQFDLLRLLETELQALGAADIRLHEYGALIATIPPSLAIPGAPVIGLLAHIDTAPAFSAANVRPIVHRAYDGGVIHLPADPQQILDPAEFPYLTQCLGHDIVTAHGDTLLGADDKAGVAILVTLAEILLSDDSLARPEVRLCFTTDEEIGRGIRALQLEHLAADVAYTLDGAEAGRLEYETFSADRAEVTFAGVSAHPGTAKGVLVNALHLAAKIIERLPQDRLTPETTADREGFIHLYALEGTAAQAKLHFILRDFELDGLAAHGQLLASVCAQVAATEPRARIHCEIAPQYRNMRYWLEQDMQPVDLARRAMQSVGVTPIERPIRGGTDGSQLTERGVPTPNLFTGMQNIHGPREWISLQDMATATRVCLALLEHWSKEPRAARPGSQ